MTVQTTPAFYSFDAFRLDCLRESLLDASGTQLHVRPKAFAMLRYFLEHPGRLLTRDELLDAVWSGVTVTDDSLTQCISDLRQAFGIRAPHVLRTVPRRGYILTADVRREETAPAAAPGATTPPSPGDVADLREDPVTISRFEAPDGDPAALLCAETMAADLVMLGTRIEGLRVLRAPDGAAQSGYRVTGEVRTVGADRWITLRLEDVASGATIWAERFGQQQDAPPSLPEAMMLALAAQLNRQVARHSLLLARRKPLETLSARELCLMGREHHIRVTEKDTALARELFARAIRIDPDYGQAYAWQAYTVQRAITHGWGEPKGQEARDESLRLARRAAQLQPESTLCLARLAFALVMDQRWDEAVAAAHAALRSSRPAFGYTRITCCEVLTAAGHPEEAARLAQETITFEPLCPPTAYGILGRALLLCGKAEEALPPLRWCALHLPEYAATYDTLVVALTEGGHEPEALAAWRELRRLKPGWEPRNHTGFWYFRRGEDLSRFQSAHRKMAEIAGVDEELPAAQAPPRLLHHPLWPDPRSTGAQTLAALRRETLVVHALQGVDDEPATTHAASAFTASLLAELVRYEDLSVVAGADARVTHGFALLGGVHTASDQLQALVRLDDNVTGAAIWANRIEWPSSRPRDVPIDRVAKLAAAVDLQIGRLTLQRARETDADKLTARELASIGKELYARGTVAETAAARQSFARASAIDPGYAASHALHALSVSRAVIHGWPGESHRDLVEQAVRLARRAVELQPDSPLALASLAHSLALQQHWGEAVTSARLALRTGRVAGDTARIAAGDALAAAGHPVEAEEALRYAIERDPHCSPLVHLVLGRALLLAGRSEDALSELRLCVARLPDYALAYRTMVVAAVEAGLVEEACDAARQVGRLRPEWLQNDEEPIFWFLRREEDRMRYQRAFAMGLRIEATARTGGLLKAPSPRA